MEADKSNSHNDNLTSDDAIPPSDSKYNKFDIEHMEQELVAGTDDARLSRETSEPKEDTELFELLIQSWKCQEIKSQILENDLKQTVQCLEKREMNYKTKISDLEVTNELMQKTIDSLHNELDLVDKLKKELDEKKEMIESLDSKLTLLKKQLDEKAGEYELQIAQNQKGHEKEMENLQNEIFNKLQEKDKEVNDVLTMKNSEVEQLRKDKTLEFKKLIANYEGKLAAAHDEKMAALMDQQHRFSTNQEMLRQKFEYSQRQYVTEINDLKEQVRIVQKPTPGNRRSAPKQTVVAKPLFKKAKNF